MAAVLLSKLISRARDRADMPIPGFVTDATLTDWLNEGAAAVHEKLVTAYGEQYSVTVTNLLTVAGSYVVLPADFFKLLGVEMTVGGRTRTLLPYTEQERNVYKNSVLTNGALPRYGFEGSPTIPLLRLLPALPTGTTITLRYAPEFALLVNPGDSVIFPNGWEKYVVEYAARKMLLKEESSVTDCDRDLAKWDIELEELAKNRDAAAPKKAVDMDAVEYDDLWGP
jgi:hypothetical protein